MLKPKQQHQSLIHDVASLVGLSATKIGSGDKETAYVVKQNSLLRCLLFFLLSLLFIASVMFSTVLELKVTKRGLVESVITGHQRETHDHLQIITLSLDLQQHLEQSLHSITLFEEFRSIFDRLAGNTLAEFLVFLPKEHHENVDHQFASFVDKINGKLGRFISRFERTNKNTLDKIQAISKRLVEEINSEGEHQVEFRDKLKELKIDQEEIDEFINDEEEEESRESKQEEEELTAHLTAFFEKLNQLPKIQLVPLAIEKMELAMKEFALVLQDGTKEGDLQAYAAQMKAITGYESTNTASVVEFYEELLLRARLEPRKAQLMDLYNGWKEPTSPITVAQVVAEIENIAKEDEMVLRIFQMVEEDNQEEEKGQVQ